MKTQLNIKLLSRVILFLPVVALAESLQVTIVDVDGHGVSDMVVYLDNDAPNPVPKASGSREIMQQDKKFAPYVSAIQQGETLAFSNSDDITHHVYSFNSPSRFSFKLREGELRNVSEFDEPGVVAMGCNIHDWMNGYVLVVETPYYAITDANGVAVIDAIVPGEYHLAAWHPQLAEEERLQAHVFIPQTESLGLRLAHPMKAVPEQKSLDDFDFLEGY